MPEVVPHDTKASAPLTETQPHDKEAPPPPKPQPHYKEASPPPMTQQPQTPQTIGQSLIIIQNLLAIMIKILLI
jgi:hypothetical protein